MWPYRCSIILMSAWPTILDTSNGDRPRWSHREIAVCRTQIAPGVQLLAADHPREPELRRALRELARPVTVGADVWIGAGAIVCPGVTVGDDSIIGAGSVVTRDVPAGVMAAGNPCRVVREL